MSNNQLAGFPAFGPRVDSLVTYHPQNIVYDPTIELPTSEPATAQVQITIAASDYPTFTGHIPSIQYVCALYACVKNLSGGYRNVYAKYKSANAPTWSSTIQLSNLDNNYDSSVSCSGLTTFSVGDVQEVKLWASNTGVYLTDSHLVIYCNAIVRSHTRPLIDVAFSMSSTGLLSGKTAISSQGAYSYVLPDYKGSTTQISSQSAASVSMSALGVYPSTIGGILLVSAVRNAWETGYNQQRYHQPYYPTRIAYTPIL